MSFHILLPSSPDCPAIRIAAEARQGPRHAMCELAALLPALVHSPGPGNVGLVDRLRAGLLPSRPLWALARHVSAQSSPGDAIFCSSEAGGLHIATVLAERATRPRLAVFVHNIARPRARLALRRRKVVDALDLFMACSAAQIAFVRDELGVPAQRVQHVRDHTDTRFFTPGPPSPDKKRPMIVSVGLEQRDYRTLAEATHDLDVDVRISGFSKDAAPLARAFPDTLPANMSRRFYSWPDLVQLYRDADVVVVSCHPNRYAAGVQSLMEAMACGRPVVATATVGLSDYVRPPVVSIAPSDPAGMRRAIVDVLARPGDAAEMGAAGRGIAEREFAMERYLDEVSGAMRSLVGA